MSPLIRPSDAKDALEDKAEFRYGFHGLQRISSNKIPVLTTGHDDDEH